MCELNDNKVGTHLEPDDNQIPKPNHADLERSEVRPPVDSRVFDRDDIHRVEDDLHRQKAREEPERVTEDRRGRGFARKDQRLRLRWGSR